MNARPCQLELLIALIKFVRLFKNDGDVDFFWVVLQHFHVGGEVSVHERLPHAQQHGQEDVNWKGRNRGMLALSTTFCKGGGLVCLVRLLRLRKDRDACMHGVKMG